MDDLEALFLHDAPDASLFFDAGATQADVPSGCTADEDANIQAEFGHLLSGIEISDASVDHAAEVVRVQSEFGHFLSGIDISDLSLDHAEAGASDQQQLSDLFFPAAAPQGEILLEGVRLGPEPSPSKIPAGIVRHSSAWGQHIRSMRQSTPITIHEPYQALKAGWDNIPRRHGDMACDLDSQGRPKKGLPWSHANCYTMPSVVKAAFQELGKGTQHLSGVSAIDSDRRGLSNLLTISGLTDHLYRQCAEDLYSKIQREASRESTGLVMCRHFDSSPSYYKFGKLAGDLMPHARYLQFVEPTSPEGYGYWKTVSYEQYRQNHPNLAPQSGVLEILAHRSRLAWASSETGPSDSQEFVQPPRVIRRTNASTCLSALDDDTPAFSLGANL